MWVKTAAVEGLPPQQTHNIRLMWLPLREFLLCYSVWCLKLTQRTIWKDGLWGAKPHFILTTVLIMKSQKKYLKKPNHCPFCNSDYVQGESVNIDDNGAHQEVNCMDCNGSWHDNYRLISYTVNKTPTGDEIAQAKAQRKRDKNVVQMALDVDHYSKHS